MRRDDTDIFADKNEGKVLIMDNLFAQTNASHLLIPLMDMAKKSNTQFICLTGLGGESIYNRFDNIYVLNLIAASLRGGTQYLKAEHKRGKEPDELVTARIEVGGSDGAVVLRKITAIILCVILLSLQVVIASAEDIRKNITVSHEPVCVMPYFYLSREKNERFFYVLFCSGYTNNSYQNNIDRA